MPKLRFFAVALLCQVLLLGGCSQPGTKATDDRRAATPVEQAEQMLVEAAGSIAPQRQRLQLEAASLFRQAGDRQRALQTLERIDSNQLPDERYGEFILLYTELALGEEAYFQARDLLTDSRMETIAHRLPLAQQTTWLRMRGELFDLLGEDENSIAAFVALSRASESADTKASAHEQLWQVLIHLSPRHLEDLLSAETDSTLLGWYNLASLLRDSQGDINQQLDQIEQWRSRWPGHPAALTPPASLMALQQVASSLPTHIAVLLPFDGSLAQAGEAIRDGVLAAWYKARGYGSRAPRIHFYDTSADTGVTAVYQQAVAEGAQLVIGPVQREDVEQLLQMPALPVPTIALNYL